MQLWHKHITPRPHCSCFVEVKSRLRSRRVVKPSMFQHQHDLIHGLLPRKMVIQKPQYLLLCASDIFVDMLHYLLTGFRFKKPSMLCRIPSSFLLLFCIISDSQKSLYVFISISAHYQSHQNVLSSCTQRTLHFEVYTAFIQSYHYILSR